jgi:hypothetical protein
MGWVLKCGVALAFASALCAGCYAQIVDPSPERETSAPATGSPAPSAWWSVVPNRPNLPRVGRADWIRQPLDTFVLSDLEAAGLTPQPEAEKLVLVRRVSLDARGLPPRPDEIDAFLADGADGAYERLVDRMLDDPAYGEHRAHSWLDVARYADTHGFELDNFRSIWPYRDYVVRAFNDNMRFDRFTIEQLAGDLLPQATVDQRVATGFIRNSMSTGEGGAIEDEFAAIAAKDRVETVAAAWLGLTVGCAACHDHKFDPITQKDFYRMTAFFRNTTQGVFDENVEAPPPFVLVGAEQTPSLVTQERDTPAFANVLLRGRYDQLGERVKPGVPQALPPLGAGQPANRLGLARWLVAAENPLTARVVINRFWSELFGAGIVRTPENFGRMGAAPTNPALLDWLAVELEESGWDVKHMLRLMLTSATYRQAATHTAAGDDFDPDNKLLWHGPRFRLDAEVIRDQALAASGLLVDTQGGPPVKPYQPEGVWESVAIDTSTTAVYEQDTGDALFRRSLYTFWKRAAPPPTLQLLNAPTRESTVVQRERTNTPLQALAIMNDPQFLEAARHLGVNALRASGGDVTTGLDFMARRLLARTFDALELETLTASLRTQREYYDAHPDAAAQLLAVGATPVADDLPAPEQAAWMLVASELFSTDEAVMK